MASKKDSTNTATINPNKAKAVKAAIAAIQKKRGAETINLYSELNSIDVVHEPTGSIAFDYITGGGLARGRVHEFFGPEGSGKTSVALQSVAEIQKKGGVAAFIDVEHALDPQQAARLGVDMNSLILSQPNYAEQALDIMEDLINSNVVDIVILDSVAALVPKAELEGSMEDNQVGLIARVMGKALRKITGAASKTGTIVVFINQVREAVGVMYGNPEVTPGGKALKFYCSIRIRVSKGKQITDKKTKQPIGQHVFLKCKKNKVGMPYLDAETDFYFLHGMDAAYDIATYGAQFDVIGKKGRTYTMPDGEPIMYKGEPVTNKDTLAAALHDRKTGLIDAFYKPTLDAMDAYIRDSLDEVHDDEEDEEDDLDELMDTLDNAGTDTAAIEAEEETNDID